MVAYTYYEIDPRVRREAETLVRKGYEVDFICLHSHNNQESSEEINGVWVIHLPLSKKRGGISEYVVNYTVFIFLSLMQVSIRHIQQRYHVIHVHNMPNFLVFSAMIPKIMGVPIILDIHDPMPELFETIFRGKALGKIIKQILDLEEQVSMRFADFLITVSKPMAKLLVSRGASSEKITIIHNLPDLKLFHSTANIMRQPNTLIYAGTISPRHGLDLFIKALGTLKNEIPELKIHFVGDGPGLSALKDLTQQLDLGKRIFFDGVVSIEQVPVILASAQAAIASYEQGEFANLVFPTKALEALSLNVPVICSRVPAVMDYFNEDALFFFQPGDVNSIIEQIRLIVNNPSLVAAKMKKSKEILRGLNWENEKDALLQLYAEALSKS